LDQHAVPYYCNIPAEVSLDKSLSPSVRIFYGHLMAFTTKRGYAWLSNETIAKWYGVHEHTVPGWLTELEAKGYIKIRSRMSRYRKIYPMIGVGKRRADEIPDELPSGKGEGTDLYLQENMNLPSGKPEENSIKNTRTRGGQSPTPFKLLQSTFFQFSREEKGIDPQWSGKEGSLLKADMERLRSISDLNPDEDWIKLFNGMIVLFFKDKVPKVAKFAQEAGYSYGVFHSQIDSILAWLDKEN